LSKDGETLPWGERKKCGAWNLGRGGEKSLLFVGHNFLASLTHAQKKRRGLVEKGKGNKKSGCLRGGGKKVYVFGKKRGHGPFLA